MPRNNPEAYEPGLGAFMELYRAPKAIGQGIKELVGSMFAREQSAGPFETVMDFVFEEEGGFFNDRGRGGRTNFGISEQTHPRAFDEGLPTKDDATEIYRREYWDAIQGDDVWEQNKSLATALMDFAVNSGVPNAVEGLQRVVGAPVDGAMGPITLDAVENYGPSQAGPALVEERERFLGNWFADPKNAGVKKGVMNRIQRNRELVSEESP